MNDIPRNLPVHRGPPVIDEGDLLLADVVRRVQLAPSRYKVAAERHETLAEHIGRYGSPLHGRIVRVYPQGSMAIGATIAARASNDEYDVDAMVELLESAEASPKAILDRLFEAVRGEPGSRYYDMAVRCSRCVQVRYGDRMHVDLTPAVLRAGRPERESVIFHHRPETPSVPGYHVVANPYGFAAWFKAQTPPEPLLKALLHEGMTFDQRVQAETEPLPDQTAPHEASRALASLQLIKRFRNLRYNNRDGRCPPSILLTKQVASHVTAEPGLARALLSHAVAMLQIFKLQQTLGRRLEDRNPVCWEDVLTDRWPASLNDQQLWIRDLEHFVRQMTIYCHGRAGTGEISLEERQTILAELFGEVAAKAAVAAFAERLGADKRDSQVRFAPDSGRLVLPAAPALIRPQPQGARREPPTTYYGGRLPWRR